MTLGEIAMNSRNLGRTGKEQVFPKFQHHKVPTVDDRSTLPLANDPSQLPPTYPDTVCTETWRTMEYGPQDSFDDYMERNGFVNYPPHVLEPQMETTKHPTGAVRSSDTDDVSYHLISPIGMRRLAQTCKEGELKYSAYNWEKGFPIDSLLNHAIAHIYKFLEGDRSEDHLAHAAWNMMAAMHSEESWPELNIGILRDEFGGPPYPHTYNLSCTVPESVKRNYECEAYDKATEAMDEVH